MIYIKAIKMNLSHHRYTSHPDDRGVTRVPHDVSLQNVIVRSVQRHDFVIKVSVSLCV